MGRCCARTLLPHSQMLVGEDPQIANDVTYRSQSPATNILEVAEVGSVDEDCLAGWPRDGVAWIAWRRSSPEHPVGEQPTISERSASRLLPSQRRVSHSLAAVNPPGTAIGPRPMR
jgi:hypothetical protein